mgnify:CR=1 FL=1
MIKRIPSHWILSIQKTLMGMVYPMRLIRMMITTVLQIVRMPSQRMRQNKLIPMVIRLVIIRIPMMTMMVIAIRMSF